jgi:hypothetical protein
MVIPNKAGAVHELPLLDCHLGFEFLLQGWVIQIRTMHWGEKRISTKRQDRQRKIIQRKAGGVVK